MKKIDAEVVSDYLMGCAYILADIIGDKEVPKKDKKWLKRKVVSILEVQSILDIPIAYEKVMKKYKGR